MDMRWAICTASFLLVACPEKSVTPEDSIMPADIITAGDTLVYVDREVRQCESDGISLEASAQSLISAGIDVLQSTCGVRTGVEYPAVCGGGTADILVHEIRDVNLPDAEKLGFQEIGTLVNASAGTSYLLIDCSDRV